MRLLFVLWVLAATLIAQTAHASLIRECAGVVSYNVTDIKQNYAFQASLLQIVEQEQFNKLKENGWFIATLNGLGLSGEWDKFKEQRSRFFEALKWDLNAQQSTGLLTYAVSDTSLEAFQKCVAITFRSGGIRIVSATRGGDKGQVRVKFSPTDGAEGPYIINVTVDGGCIFLSEGKCRSTARFKVPSATDFPVQLRIPKPTGTGDIPDLSIKVEATLQNGGIIQGDGLLIPRYRSIRSINQEISRDSDVSVARGGWSTGGRASSGGTVCARLGATQPVEGELGRLSDWRRKEDGSIDAMAVTTKFGSEQNRGSPQRPSGMKILPETLKGAEPCGYAYVYPQDDDVQYYVTGLVRAVQSVKIFVPEKGVEKRVGASFSSKSTLEMLRPLKIEVVD